MYENIGTRIPESTIKEIEFLAEEEKTDKTPSSEFQLCYTNSL